MPEAVRDQQAPVPAGVRVGLQGWLSEHHGRLDVARLVVDSEVELEVGPVAGKLVDDPLEALREGGHARS